MPQPRAPACTALPGIRDDDRRGCAGAGLCFGAGLALYGLWFGLLAGNVMSVLLCVLLVLRLDWAAECNKARSRTEQTKVPTTGGGGSVYGKSPAKP